MSFIFGIISIVATILIHILFRGSIGFDLFSFKFLMFKIIPIPLGGLLAGAIAGFGYYKGLHKSNVFVSGGKLAFSIVIGILVFIGINYSTYTMTCVDETTGEFYYSLGDRENHISNYIAEEYDNFSFTGYLRYNIDSTVYNKQTEPNTTLNYFMEFVNLLGIIIGCFFIGCYYAGLPYCHKCRKYMVEEQFFTLPSDVATEYIADLQGFIENFKENQATQLLQVYTLSSMDSKQPHALCSKIMCNHCRQAKLKFEFKELNSKNNLEVNSDLTQEISVPMDLLDKVTNAMGNESNTTAPTNMG